jgi:hypothetical protein
MSVERATHFLNGCKLQRLSILKHKENIKFNWNSQGNDDFVLIPRNGHLAAESGKKVTLIYTSAKSNNYKNFGCIL